MISMPENRKLLIAACMIAAVGVFAPLFQPINGFDTKPEKVLAGDTLYEYVEERFGGNNSLTSEVFQQFPRDHKHVYLANTDKNSSDGDTIQTVGKEIIITRPSGEKVYIELVNDRQLRIRKYTQIVQDIVALGLISIVGLLVYIFIGQRTKLPRASPKKPLSIYLKLGYVSWSITIFCWALITSEVYSLSAVMVRVVMSHILLVLIPSVFFYVAIINPVLSIRRDIGLKSALACSLFAGLCGVVGFFVLQLIVIIMGAAIL